MENARSIGLLLQTWREGTDADRDGREGGKARPAMGSRGSCLSLEFFVSDLG